MKRIINPYLLFCCIILVLSSCSSSDKEISVEYDENLLLGQWIETGEAKPYCYVYKNDHSGYTWLASEDIEENEASKFTWSLDKAVLSLEYTFEVNDKLKLPKQSIITELTDSTFMYKSYAAYGGKNFALKKVIDK